MNVGTLKEMLSKKDQVKYLYKTESSDVLSRDGLTRSSVEDSVMESEPRGQSEVAMAVQPQGMRQQEQGIKSYPISKREVFNAWKKVKSNGGAAGIDGKGIEEIQQDLAKNLYKIWNRMSSGSYHPQAVRRVEIPKGDGRLRPLGIPTVLDRVAQEVVRARLEKQLEPIFAPDSYGYRPNKSAKEAVGKCRERCWKKGLGY